MAGELKPCPNCQSPNVHVLRLMSDVLDPRKRGKVRRYVVCNDCDGWPTMFADSEEGAVEQWNRRAHQEGGKS